MSTVLNRMNDPLGEIASGGATNGRRVKFVRWLLVAALVAAAALTYSFLRPAANGGPRYETSEVTRGNLVVTVSATGNLQPTNQVEVSSELSGIIEAVFVEDNDRVQKGQVLARLDTSKLEDQVNKSKAALASSEAQVQQAQASVTEASASLARLQQVAQLSGGKVPSKAEMDTAEATLQRAMAGEGSAQAAVKQARATLQSDQTNLSKASIRSPINGVVLSREVEPGQTVAASLQAPQLFILAESLSQMDLEVDVDEADVGQVREGQSATFTVDAYPNRKYPARITRVHYNSQTENGVVSYKTVLKVNNDDLSLRPGMTATAEITVARRENVLLVPNAALRFTPPTQTAGSGNTRGSIVSMLMPRPPSSSSSKGASETAGDGQAHRVWVLRDGQPAPVSVTVGNTNGSLTEVTSDELQPRMLVIVDTVEQKKK